MVGKEKKMSAKNEWGLGSTQAPTRFSHAVVFILPTIWEPGTGYRSSKEMDESVQIRLVKPVFLTCPHDQSPRVINVF